MDARVKPGHDECVFASTSRFRARLRDLAARFARGLPEIILTLQTRAQGTPGARCTRGLVCKSAQQKRTRAYRFSGGNPAFPAQWFTAYIVLSPAIGLSCHRRQRCYHRGLAAAVEASGPHAFAVRSRLRQRLRRAWYPSAEALAKAGSHAVRLS